MGDGLWIAILYWWSIHGYGFAEQERQVMDLHGEVMACGYEAVVNEFDSSDTKFDEGGF